MSQAATPGHHGNGDTTTNRKRTAKETKNADRARELRIDHGEDTIAILKPAPVADRLIQVNVGGRTRTVPPEDVKGVLLELWSEVSTVDG